MAAEWQTFRLDELCEFINGFAFKSSDYVAPSHDTIEVFRMGYIERGGGFKEDSSPVFVPRQYGKKLDKFFLQPGDVTIAMTDMKDRVAILGNTAWIRDADRFVLNQRVGCIRVKAPELLDPRFFYFYSNWPPHVEFLRSRANSGVQVNLSTPGIKEVQLTVPPLPEQKAIAAVLGALDDKIALNRRMNATLEAMARALFQSWFVDFDPVRANMARRDRSTGEQGVNAEGRPPAGLDEPTAALFPAQFQDSELGENPHGWEVQPLGDLLDTLETGRRPKGGVSSYKHGVPSVGAESIHRVGEYDYGKTKFIPDEFFATMKSGQVQSYDVLLYKDGGKPGVFLPRVSMFGEGFPFETYAINEHVFRMRSEKIGQPLLYFQLGSERLLMDLHNRGGKAAIPGINQTDVRTLQFLMPTPAVVEAFNRTCYPLLRAILCNAKQSRTLAILRDTLLPKLLSGELSVAGVEQAEGIGAQ